MMSSSMVGFVLPATTDKNMVYLSRGDIVFGISSKEIDDSAASVAFAVVCNNNAIKKT